MLVLGRKLGEEVVVHHQGVEIGRLRVVHIGDNRCKLAFDFPPEFVIWRSCVGGSTGSTGSIGRSAVCVFAQR